MTTEPRSTATPRPRHRPADGRTGPPLSRRGFLGLVGGAAAVAGTGLLGACSSSSGGGSGGSGGKGGTIALSSWNIPQDLKSYKKIGADYAKNHQGTSVNVEVTQANNFDAWLTSRLTAGNAPDVLRITYQDIGKYASQKGLVDLSQYLPKGYGDDFLPAYWATVDQSGGVFGIPQQTDGWGIYVNTDVMKKIGITVPDTMDKAWHWDEFLDIAREVKKATGKYSFSYFLAPPAPGWRWLPTLYMHGGALLDADNKKPAIDSPEGVEAIAFSQKWYAEGLIPPSNSFKASQSNTAETLFIQHQVGMMVSSDFNMNNLKGKLADDSWTVTYLFQDAHKATNMGGNALVVTRSAHEKEDAAKLVEFICNSANMKYFCQQGNFIPVRKDLASQQLEWPYRADLMKRFAEQAQTLPPAMASLQSIPQFGAINQVLTDQLELCFTGQQKPAETAKNIADGVQTALR